MSTAQNLKAVIESFAELLDGHVRLFKLELAEDARLIGVQVGKIVAFLPLVFVGYGFLCAALAMFLTRWLAADLACLAVGLLNLVLGLAAIGLAARRLVKRQLLEGSRVEASATAAAFSRAVSGQGAGGGGPLPLEASARVTHVNRPPPGGSPHG